MTEGAGRREEISKLLAVLPNHFRLAIEPQMEGLVDIILDVGRHPTLRRRVKETIQEQDLASVPVVTPADIATICSSLEPFDAQGRSGIPGCLHRVSRLCHDAGAVVGLTMRLAFAGSASLRLVQDVAASGKSILVLGPPGAGKTTLLRAFAADVSRQRAVMIVEASKEIAGSGVTCHPGVGRARRLLASSRGRPRHAAMVEAVENHTPSCLVIDEIGTREEAATARTIAARGVQLIATAHGHDLDDLLRNKDLNDLVGGSGEVILANSDPRYMGFKKMVLERQREPVFDVLLEVRSPEQIVVHWHAASAVDKLLSGARPVTELREVCTASKQLYITKIRSPSLGLSEQA